MKYFPNDAKFVLQIHPERNPRKQRTRIRTMEFERNLRRWDNWRRIGGSEKGWKEI